MTYDYCRKVIKNGRYDKTDMADKLDIFLLNNRITQEQYSELAAAVKSA